MAVRGIIAEFNPFHNGHQYILDAAKSGGNTVICAISGNFVQRGDTAVLPKSKRTQAALKCGADLVAEIPVIWSMSTAQNFALGGVSQLYSLGCDEIIFGSECGDIEKLIKTADILSGNDFSNTVAEEVKTGITFAKARQNAAEKLGAEKDILCGANDNLGIEYIIAAKRLGINIKFNCIKRMSALHDSLSAENGYVSSSFIREYLKNGMISYAENFMPYSLKGLITNDCISDINRIGNAILCSLRMKEREDFNNLPDISEGLENKLYFAINVATNLEELYNIIKTKRYTLARVRRLVLSAFLNIDGSLFMTEPPYVRILGLNSHGAEHLGKIKSKKPIITQVSQLKNAVGNAKTVFETECRATDIYALSLQRPLASGMEYKTKLLKQEC